MDGRRVRERARRRERERDRKEGHTRDGEERESCGAEGRRLEKGEEGFLETRWEREGDVSNLEALDCNWTWIRSREGFFHFPFAWAELNHDGCSLHA